MIVELCGTDLLKLVNGEQIAIGDVIVREAKGEISVVLEPPDVTRPAGRVGAASARGGSNNRRSFKSNKTGAAIITARFDSICRDCEKYEGGVDPKLPKGDEIYYDYDNKKAYCMAHGVIRFPNVKKEVSA